MLSMLCYKMITHYTTTTLQCQNLLNRTLGNDHSTQDWVSGQRSTDRGINNVDVVGANDLRIGVHASVKPAARRPVLDVAKSVVGRRANPGSDLL